MHPLLLPVAALGGLGWLSTLRLRWIGDKPPVSPCVLILWHEHLPILAHAFSHQDIAVMVSLSADGDLAANALKRLGYRIHRGSSSRGGLALRALTRAVQGGGTAGMALDGPRGPYHAAKPGAGRLAALGGVPWVPVAVQAERFFRLNTWDRCILPLPFSKVWLRLGPSSTDPTPEAMAEAMHANQMALRGLLK